MQILSVRGGGSIIDLFRRRLTALTGLSAILRPGGTKNKFARRQERKRETKGENGRRAKRLLEYFMSIVTYTFSGSCSKREAPIACPLSRWAYARSQRGGEGCRAEKSAESMSRRRKKF